MKRIYTLFVACILCINLYGQFNDTAYIYTYGGIQNDVCNQIKPTDDGGYIMIGTTNSFGCGNTDFYIIKTDSLGNHEWSKTYGGVENQEGFSVTQTFDKGYVFLGFTDSYGAGGYDVYLVKTDSMGNFQWQRTYGGSDWDFGYSIRQLADSGFVICGLTYSYGAGNGDVYVIRTNKNGDTAWTRAIGGSGYDVGNSVCVENDSLYAIVGATTSFGKGDTDVYFILINDKGVVKKTTTYGSTHNDVGNSINETLDNGFIVFGSSDSVEIDKPDEMLIKTDSIGNMQWMQIYHSSGYSIGHDVLQAPQGYYFAVSTSNSFGLGGYAMRTWQITSIGIPFLGPSYGGTGDEQGNSVALSKNGKAVFAGATNSPGNTIGLNDVYFVRMKGDSLFNIVNYYAFPYHQYKDTTSCTLGVVSQSEIAPEVKVFPNPVSFSTTILIQGVIGEEYSYSLFNGAGDCMLKQMPLQPTAHGQLIGHLEKGNLAAGIYICEILNASGIIITSDKIIVE